MRLSLLIEKPLLLLGALLVNLGLYLLVPYIQVLIQQGAKRPSAPATMTRELDFAPPPAEKLVKREIKEIKTASIDPPQPNPTRPTTPGGGLKIDLSPAGGDGLALVSGGDRTGGIGSGTGGGKGEGMAAMTYELGQTDTDARPYGQDPPLGYPPRAEREGITGMVDVLLVVNELGMVEQVTPIKEEPSGYGFFNYCVDYVKKIKFKPATLQKIPVRQRFKKRCNFGAN